MLRAFKELFLNSEKRYGRGGGWETLNYLFCYSTAAELLHPYRDWKLSFHFRVPWLEAVLQHSATTKMKCSRMISSVKSRMMIFYDTKRASTCSCFFYLLRSKGFKSVPVSVSACVYEHAAYKCMRFLHVGMKSREFTYASYNEHA